MPNTGRTEITETAVLVLPIWSGAHLFRMGVFLPHPVDTCTKYICLYIEYGDQKRMAKTKTRLINRKLITGEHCVACDSIHGHDVGSNTKLIN